MKSDRVIYILFFLSVLFFYDVMATTVIDTKNGATRALIDSVFESQVQINKNKINAKEVIEYYDVLIKNGTELEIKDYKRLAESYAHLDDAENATLYLREYIKKSFNINVLHTDAFKKIESSTAFQSLAKTYLPKINGWILLFIFSGVIGVFISIAINLRKKGDKIANSLIGLFVLFNSLFILHVCLYLTNYVYWVPHSYWATVLFSFLYGPLLYFYFKRISEAYIFKYKDILHLIPTFIIIFYFLPVYFLPGEMKLDRIFNIDGSYLYILYIILISKAISLLIYSFLAYRIYVKNIKNNSKADGEIVVWQRNMSYINVLYALTYSIYAVIIARDVVFDRSKSVMLYSQVFVLALIMIYVAYTAYVKPRVFSKKYLLNNDESTPIKYEKSGLTEGFSQELKVQLLWLLNEEKIFKSNDINLNSLSDRMGITRHNLSQVINEHFELNFFNLINKYRILEAQKIFKNDLHKNLNIIDVAYDVGFNNKVTFNKAFKEETKLTPTQYIKSLQTNSLSVNFR